MYNQWQEESNEINTIMERLFFDVGRRTVLETIGSGFQGFWFISDVYLFDRIACKILVLQQEIEPRPTEVEIQSLYHWTIREISKILV